MMSGKIRAKNAVKIYLFVPKIQIQYIYSSEKCKANAKIRAKNANKK